MSYLFLLLVFLIGLSFGSFLSVILFRLHRRSGIIVGRSECPFCFHKLGWLDLVPVVSFMWLKRRCRYCDKKIPLIYPLMEITTGLVFISYCWAGNSCLSSDGLYGLLLVFLFLILFFFDYTYYTIPDKILVLIFILTSLYHWPLGLNKFWGLLATGLIAASFFAIIYLASRGRWIGFGDVKMAFVIGLVLDYPQTLIAILGSIWIGALWGIGLMLLKRATMKSALPFGSFMAAATIVLIIFANYDLKILQIFKNFYERF